jgi:periplasmic protein TonB
MQPAGIMPARAPFYLVFAKLARQWGDIATRQFRRARACLCRGHLLQTFRAFSSRQLDRLRDRRVAGAAGALVLELLLVLVVLTMGLVEQKPGKPDSVLTSVSVRQAAEKKQERAKPEPARASKSVQSPRAVQPETLQKPVPAPSPAFIPLPKSDMAKFDISNLPRQPQAAPAPGKAMMGPPDTGSPGDSKRVGTAPNGEPMYAATWYREPSEDELRGYLSTATGPGWALITCRTVADFRVEDCVGLDEYPDRSQMLRAVLAAAWQFRVRPPRRGGVSRVGDWVRIRIEYTEGKR